MLSKGRLPATTVCLKFNSMKNLIYLTTIITLLVSCKPKESEKDTAMLEVQKPLVLKEALSGKFLMGTALNARQINGYNPVSCPEKC